MSWGLSIVLEEMGQMWSKRLHKQNHYFPGNFCLWVSGIFWINSTKTPSSRFRKHLWYERFTTLLLGTLMIKILGIDQLQEKGLSPLICVVLSFSDNFCHLTLLTIKMPIKKEKGNIKNDQEIKGPNWAQWSMPRTPVLGRRRRQEDCELKAGLRLHMDTLSQKPGGWGIGQWLQPWHCKRKKRKSKTGGRVEKGKETLKCENTL